MRFQILFNLAGVACALLWAHFWGVGPLAGVLAGYSVALGANWRGD